MELPEPRITDELVEMIVLPWYFLYQDTVYVHIIFLISAKNQEIHSSAPSI